MQYGEFRIDPPTDKHTVHCAQQYVKKQKQVPVFTTYGSTTVIMFTRLFASIITCTRKFTRRASKRRCVLFAAGWHEPGVIFYHI